MDEAHDYTAKPAWEDRHGQPYHQGPGYKDAPKKSGFRRIKRNVAIILWFVLLLCLLPLFVLYGIGLCIVWPMGKLTNVLGTFTFTHLAGSLYISRAGKVIHQGERVDMSDVSADLRAKSIVPAHMKSMCFAGQAHNGGNVEVHTIAVLGDNLNYLVINPAPAYIEVPNLTGDEEHPPGRDAASGAIPYLRAFLVDLSDAPVVIHFIKRKEIEYGLPIKIEGILLTHTHHDHSMGVEDFITRLPKVWKRLYGPQDVPKVIASNMERGRNEFVTHVFEQRESVMMNMAGIDLECIHAPGHTWGSVVFLTKTLPQYAFTGDTLFIGGRGHNFDATDDMMLYSIFRLLSVLDRYNSKILPGHTYTMAGAVLKDTIRHIEGLAEMEDKVLDGTSSAPHRRIANPINEKWFRGNHHPLAIYLNPVNGVNGPQKYYDQLCSRLFLFKVCSARTANFEPFIATTVQDEIYLNEEIFTQAERVSMFSECMHYIVYLISAGTRTGKMPRSPRGKKQQRKALSKAAQVDMRSDMSIPTKPLPQSSAYPLNDGPTHSLEYFMNEVPLPSTLRPLHHRLMQEHFPRQPYDAGQDVPGMSPDGTSLKFPTDAFDGIIACLSVMCCMGGHAHLLDSQSEGFILSEEAKGYDLPEHIKVVLGKDLPPDGRVLLRSTFVQSLTASPLNAFLMNPNHVNLLWRNLVIFALSLSGLALDEGSDLPAGVSLRLVYHWVHSHRPHAPVTKYEDAVLEDREHDTEARTII